MSYIPPGGNTKPVPDTVTAALAKAREKTTEVEAIEAEIVEADMTADEAREVTDRIRGHVEDVWELIQQAYTRRAWQALRYGSWDEYCIREFGDARLRIPREERPDMVRSLRQAGLSLRAIESATGVSRPTIIKDLSGQVVNSLPPEPDEDTLAEELIATAPPITGVDGKTYPARPKPKPKPETPEPEALEPDLDDEIEPCATMAKRTSRPQLWAQACDAARAALQDMESASERVLEAFSELQGLQEEYQEWYDNMPEQL